MTPPSPPFTKILIANRGEIAVRVIRACRELGIQTLAVYSDPDSSALHARMADEAVRAGPAEASESYLQGERIIQAALERGAQAIHPGYGFLSENAAFARAAAEAGLTFIGPSPEAIRAMGDKAEARTLMQQSGVPVVPGYQGLDSDEELAAAAQEIGYPVLVKAAAGGGGKGMRVVDSPADMADGVESARREARNAFGDTRLIVEKYLPHARHVEIQVLADEHGNTIHLNERECSVQRRHQKIIEETPSPLLDADLRARMGADAVAAAEAVGYTNAGTVEFIVDPETRAYYFLEMNTRLQVEHPITELTTGIDLVNMQIQIAGGHPLPSELLKPLPPHGHAIECRLYAEDPASGFLPAVGPVLKFLPPDGPGVRVDAGVATGDAISTHYDPMIAKLIVHGPDRPSALRRMQAALQDTVLLGVTTNLGFLQDVLSHPVFQGGEATTRFIDEHMPGWQPAGDIPWQVLAAAALAAGTQKPERGARKSPALSPWDTLTNFRLSR